MERVSDKRSNPIVVRRLGDLLLILKIHSCLELGVRCTVVTNSGVVDHSKEWRGRRDSNPPLSRRSRTRNNFKEKRVAASTANEMMATLQPNGRSRQRTSTAFPRSSMPTPPWKAFTGAMNLYPRRGSVSTKRGLSAESPRASRSLLIAVFRLLSKSTNVSFGHICERSSS